MANFLLKLKLVVWKNLIVRKRHKFLTIFEILMSVILFMILAIVQSKLPDMQSNHVDHVTYYEKQYLDDDSSPYSIFYAPQNSKIDELMNKVASNFYIKQPENFRGFSSEDAMLSYIDDLRKNDSNIYYSQMLGVVFDRFPDTSLPTELKYTIRTAMSDEFGLAFPIFPPYGGYQPSRNYIHSGFVQLQKSIDFAFIEMKGGNLANIKMTLEEVPSPPHDIGDPLVIIFNYFIPFFGVLSFILIFPSVLKRVIEEKASGIKELMKMMGLEAWMIWLGWFIHSMVTNLIAIIFIICMLKIPFSSDSGAIFPNTNIVLLFLFLFLYCASGICFAFAVSTVFNRPTLGTSLGMILWNISFFATLPVADQPENMSQCVVNLFLLFPNTCLIFGFRGMNNYEQSGGQTFSNLWTKQNPYSNAPPLGQVLLMLFVDSLLLLIITWYIDNVFPGEYGTARPWYFPFMKSYWYSNKVESDSVDDRFDDRPEVELVATDLQPGVQIRKLRKHFKNKYAVDELSLDIYNKQITVLLGHNGAGKTTTMNIITGMITASSGTVLVDGHNIRTNLNQVRASLGLCPQHNLQFPDLTVVEHLMFFAMLKGRSKAEARAESVEFLQRLHISTKTNKMAKELSGGMRRKLSLGMALVGQTKVLMLDEPTSGLDPEARREIWDFLLSMRGERTILITTHHMEEADILGDRIAIMHHGTLMCYGTSLFLKKYYGTGYTLSMLTNPDWNMNTLTTEIQDFVPSAVIKNIATGTVVFSLPTNDTDALSKLFINLEQQKERLGIANFGVSITSLEDVFLKVGEIADEVDKASSKHSDDDSGKYLIADNYIGQSENATTNSASVLLCQQTLALFIKRINFTMHKWIFFILQALIPIILGFVMFLILKQSSGKVIDTRFDLTLKHYPKAESFYSYNDEHTKNFAEKYSQVVKSQHATATEVTDVAQRILEIAESDDQKYHRSIITSAEFNKSQTNDTLYLNGYFGDYAIHGPAISLNIITNTLLKLFTQDDNSISTANSPLPAYYSNDINPGLVMMWVFQIPIAYALMVAFFIGFPQGEKVTGVKHLQLMYGVPRYLYWLSNYIFDYIVYIIVTFFVLLVLLIVDAGGAFGNWGAICPLASLLLLFGLSVLPFSYLFTYRQTAASSLTAFLWVHLLLGTIGAILILLLKTALIAKYKTLITILEHLFLLVPNFAISDGISNFASRTSSIHKWTALSKSDRVIQCKISYYPCCESETSPECLKFYSYFQGDNSIEKNVVFLCLQVFLYWAILLFIDSGYPKYWVEQLLDKVFYKPDLNAIDNNLDYDVSEEKKRVGQQVNESSRVNSAVEREQRIEDILLVSNLKKWFKRFYAVRGLNFGVKKGECFGLLGINGAGKTTTFKMLTGEIFPTTGYANLMGCTLTQDKNQYLKNIGYCPQFDALNMQLSTKEMLTFFARIRGIKAKKLNGHVNHWLKKFDIKKYENIACQKLSGGNRRKLSTAIALIGDPPLVMLDEPTSGVDPVARRNLWDILAAIRRSGQSVVLTSHSMDECEALCDRLGIMVDGQMKCLGNIQYLKNKFGQGFTVMVKLRNISTMGDEIDANPLVKLKNSIENKFACTLKDEHTGMVLYHVTNPDASLGDLFSYMEGLKRSEEIVEDYTVSDTSLEQVFLSFAKEKDRLPSASAANAIV